MTTVLQGNMNRSRTAHELLPQLITERDVDLLIISEQYRNKNSPTWYANSSSTSAIWVYNTRKVRVIGHGSEDHFVWVSTGEITYVSVYLSPNSSAHEYQAKLEALEDSLRDFPGNIMVAGDFNARAAEWGMLQTNRRGKLVLEMVARLDLVVLNEGSVTTYRRPGFGSSIPDITLASGGMASSFRRWRVIEGYTGSDHQYITFDLMKRHGTGRTQDRRFPRWNVKLLNHEKLCEIIQNAAAPSSEPPRELTGTERAEALVDSTMRLIRRACVASMPVKKRGNGRRSAYWWTEEIAELRRNCLKLRRRAQRARNRSEAADLSRMYKQARKSLRYAIKQSKHLCWRKLCDEVDSDPWGLGYKIVTRRLGALGPIEAMDPQTMNTIIDGLFPTHTVRTETPTEERRSDIPAFTREELFRAVSLLKGGKAPGPDGTPAEVLKVIAVRFPQLLLKMYNTCLEEGVFSARWKKAKLVLIIKGKGDPNSPSAYRPLSLLDTPGKTLELLLKPRIANAIQDSGGLSERQYGFRKGRSTIGAVREVVAAFQKIQETCHKARSIAVLVTLDVKNAFNSARWTDILEALRTTFKIPEYLLHMVEDYLRNRQLVYETAVGAVVRDITAGVAQGSILGPDFWNVLYDGILRMEMPEDAFLVGYADDIAAVIVARNVELAQLKLNQVMRRVDRWMSEHGLQLALAKTEIVLLTRKRAPTIIPMMVGTEQVLTRASAKYLGITLDTKLTFWPHIKSATVKASARIAALSRLMENMGGPRSTKRKLLMSTAHSILLYGVEIWADAMETAKYRKRMAAVQRRGALRIACSYRTVSEAAVLVISGVIPIDLLARERKRIYNRSAEVGRTEATPVERTKTMDTWQERWTNEPKGRWTFRLIKNLRRWMDREFGEVNFYLTQLLSGHGYFRHYLFNMRKVQSPDCKYCRHARDDAEHTFFVCVHWSDLRQELATLTGRVTPDNIVNLMTDREEWWSAIVAYVEHVLRRKKADGCLMDEGD